MRILQKTFFALVIGAVVTAFAAPTDSFAQQQQTDQVNQGNLIAALNNISANVQDVQALNDLAVEDVRVVNVQDVLNSTEAFRNAINRNDVSVLTEFLNSNKTNVDILKDALNQNDVAVNDVVAVSVLSGGDVVLYYQE